MTKLRKAQEFFLKHAGSSYPANAGPFERRREQELGALALAKAEKWLRESGNVFVLWVPDDEPYQMGDAETEMPREVLGCVLVRFTEEYVEERGANDLDMKHGEVLGSLWSIGDPSWEYRRVVGAELALEAMDDA